MEQGIKAIFANKTSKKDKFLEEKNKTSKHEFINDS